MTASAAAAHRGAVRRPLAELLVALVAVAAAVAIAGGALPVRHDGAARSPSTAVDPAALRGAGIDNPCHRGEIALTFDDGPDAHTAAVLRVLRAYGVRATFFVLGAKVRARPHLVPALVADGHLVENHSWDHPHLTDLAPAQVHAQLADTQAAVQAAGAPPPTMVRPPFGDTGPVVQAQARMLGLRVVTWTFDTDDWRGTAPADITAGVLGHLSPGAVILLHDGIRQAANTVRALPAIIEGLRAHGYCTAPMR